MDTTALSFRLRSAMPWSPSPTPTPPLRLAALRERLRPRAALRFDALEHKHDLEPLTRAPHVEGALEALWATDVLDRALGAARLPPGPALDVGAKNATHLPGQYAYRPGPWDLVEIDAHRRYVDFTTRGAHGRAMAARFRAARYLAQDVNTVAGRYALITWFLPFVVESPHRAWGLPAGLFQPAQTLAHVLSLLVDGGALVIVNQGEAEAEVQARLLDDVKGDVEVVARGVVDDTLSPYTHQRFAFVVRRRA